MGKSLGNFLTLKDAFQRWRPPVVRFFVLQSQYRSTLDFSSEAVEAAARGLEKLVNTVRNLRDAIRSAPPSGRPSGIDLARHRTSFCAAMDDDFNSPQAIAELFAVASEVNQLLSATNDVAAPSLQEVESFFQQYAGKILGISFEAGTERGEERSGAIADLLTLLIGIRADVRAQKLWALSDKIRDGLGRLGYSLEDKREGTTWKRTS